MCKICLKSKLFNYTINCYAPKEENAEEVKKSFYDLLENTIRQNARHVKIVIGDINVKIS